MSDEQKKQSSRKRVIHWIMSISSLVLALPNVLCIYYLIKVWLVGDPGHGISGAFGIIFFPYAITVGIFAIALAKLTFKFITSKISLVINVIPLIIIVIGLIFYILGIY